MRLVSYLDMHRGWLSKPNLMESCKPAANKTIVLLNVVVLVVLRANFTNSFKIFGVRTVHDTKASATRAAALGYAQLSSIAELARAFVWNRRDVRWQ